MSDVTELEECPRVWVGCLAAYNDGTLHGEWVDVPIDPDTLRDEIARVLKASPIKGAEEWGFFDNEYLPAYLSGEYASVDELCEYADGLERADLNGLPAYLYRAACEDQGETVDPDCIQVLHGRGDLRDWSDVAMAASDEWGGLMFLTGDDLPERVRQIMGRDEHIPVDDTSVGGYLDWERIGRDYFLHDGWEIADGIAYKVAN